MAFGLTEKKPLAVAEVSPAAASTVAGAIVIVGLGVFGGVSITAELLGATGGVLDVYIQMSPDQGTTWYDVVHFPQLAAGAAAIIYTATLARGTSQAAPVVIGKNLVPALAANTAVQGEFGDRLRAVYKAGASTSAGAAQTITITATRNNY